MSIEHPLVKKAHFAVGKVTSLTYTLQCVQAQVAAAERECAQALREMEASGEPNRGPRTGATTSTVLRKLRRPSPRSRRKANADEHHALPRHAYDCNLHRLRHPVRPDPDYHRPLKGNLMNPIQCSRCPAPSDKTVETRHFGTEPVCEGCADALRQDGQLARRRFTLPDLVDRKNLIAWLAYDGNPPTVEVPIFRQDNHSSYGCRRGMIKTPRTETKPVTDEGTISIWWDAHRRALSIEFGKSAFNQHKPQTHTQWIAECLKSIGIKGFGTVAQRVQRAIAFRPDLYKDAKSVKAEAEAERLRCVALYEQMKADRAAAKALEGSAA